MLFRIVAISLSLAVSSVALATDYFTVLPNQNKPPKVPLTVTLNAHDLPAGMVTRAYSFDLNSLLSVTGAEDFTPAAVNWSIPEGTLPTGLSMAQGVVSGTPTTPNGDGTSFTVKAIFKRKAGSQAYTIVINEEALEANQISIGGDGHACAVTPEGGVKCWGLNTSGQLGNGNYVNSARPAAVQGLPSQVVEIRAGNAFTCARHVDGAVTCWGNFRGYFGPGPVAVPFPGAATSLTLGDRHACAVVAGKVWCVGSNSEKQLGIDGASTYNSPLQPAGTTSDTYVQVAAGKNHSCALTDQGNVKCWGAGSDGRLGTGGNYSSSTAVSTAISNVKSIAGAGGDFICALLNDSSARCWGNNSGGFLGDGSGANRYSPVTPVGLSSGVVSISAGLSHSCASMVDGTARCWGAGDGGKIGNGSAGGNIYSPTLVQNMSSAAQVAAGGTLSCAIMRSGIVKCWGTGTGNTTTSNSTTPVTTMP